ncbi:transcriptional regulator [Listeria ivanovii]|uniref:helix-turn-helix domain-containing protein n=1 Tax=Listeria ivanovii TaxID=1638 RepID=UPI000DA9920F|nr:helix-turn-helix domain-containing protein [Listeria ivanovii]PZG31178.1 transcriptional regulator [Listeria ivanovii]PZG44974.1 transcriptional regulator [Listeria ivanovii]PZH08447.1 transcriptional regulator [Listeria ivanovii]
MLINYIEKDIKRKCLICDFLFKNKHTDLDEVAEYMGTSRVTVKSDIQALNEELADLVTIQMNTCHDNLVYRCQLHNGVTERQALHKLYDRSMFLKCLAFLITNEDSKSFTDFMDQYFISHSHAYRLKHKVEAFLAETDLLLENNLITGKEYRVRYLIALLQAEYGILIVPLLDKEKRIVDDFMSVLNRRINVDNLAHNAEGHEYFRLLISMVFKRDIPTSAIILDEQCQKYIETSRFLDMVKESSKETLEKELGYAFSYNDYLYLMLIYYSTNFSIVDASMKRIELEQFNTLILKEADLQCLVGLFETYFGTEVVNHSLFRVALCYFLKKTLFDLQGLIPSNERLLDKKYQPLYLVVKNVLERWNELSNRYTLLIDSHIHYLTIHLYPLIYKWDNPVPICIFSFNLINFESCKFQVQQELGRKVVVNETMFNSVEELNLVLQESPMRTIVLCHPQCEMTLKKLVENGIVIPISLGFFDRDLEDVESAIQSLRMEEYEKRLACLKS